MRLNAKQIAEYTGAHVLVQAIDPSRLVSNITWDSREVSAGDAYVALPGNRVDGHDFIEEVLCAGAAVVLVMRPFSEAVRLRAQEMGAAVLEVASTQTALIDLARAWRGHLKGKVIAITGSTGKTTTKNLVRDVLATTYRTVATQGNQNNELGVPKTLLNANPETEYIVVEMGMRGLGQLASLCEYVKPDIALITNTGESHIELLGSRQAIVEAKAEVIQALPDQFGIAVLNYAQEESVREIKALAQVSERHIKVIGFDGGGNDVSGLWDTSLAGATDTSLAVATDGTSATTRVSSSIPHTSPQVFAQDITLDTEGRPRFNLHIPEGTQTCTLTLRGVHNVYNACAAAAVGYACKVSMASIVNGLESSQPEVGRQEITTNSHGVIVINDAYNANPDSMRAALLLFASMDVPGKRIAVLGDMGELGDYAQSCHEGIGSLAAQLSLDYLICVGNQAAFIADAAKKSEFPTNHIFETLSLGEALGFIEPLLSEGDAVLVKASHSMEFDRIVRGLLN